MCALWSDAASFGVFVGSNSAKAQDRAVEGADVDAALVARARDGEVQAFRLLVEKYQNKAHAIALGVVGNYEDAEDVIQEAFLKAYRNLSLFRGQSSFYTWLYRIVFNLAIDLSRKRYRHVEASVGEAAILDMSPQQGSSVESRLLSRPQAPDERIETSELAAQIRRSMDNLTPEHRAVIVLREIEGLSYAEISDIVGCSKGTVMSRLHHARKRLQKALAEYAPVRSSGRKPREGAAI